MWYNAYEGRELNEKEIQKYNLYCLYGFSIDCTICECKCQNT